MAYILLFIAAIQGVFSIDKLFKESFKARPWIIFGALLIATGISFWIEHRNSEKEIAKQKSDSLRDVSKDSMADVRIAKSNKQILNGIGEAIGKYSLGYDSAKKEISALKKLLKDSLKTLKPEGDQPDLSFCPNDGLVFDHENYDSLVYHIKICCTSAPSILNYAKIYVVISPNKSYESLKNLVFVGQNPVFTKNIGIGTNTYKSQMLWVGNNRSFTKTIIILLVGKYKNSNGKNEKEIDEVGYLDVEAKSFGLMTTPYDDQVREFLRSKGVYQ